MARLVCAPRVVGWLPCHGPGRSPAASGASRREEPSPDRAAEGNLPASGRVDDSASTSWARCPPEQQLWPYLSVGSSPDIMQFAGIGSGLTQALAGMALLQHGPTVGKYLPIRPSGSESPYDQTVQAVKPNLRAAGGLVWRGLPLRSTSDADAAAGVSLAGLCGPRHSGLPEC